uniref:NADH-ubiquinone oxidoreductase chain 3 n=1 Tax=Histeroidea sp. 3 KM-2017 TaxID=2219436 RepID=A0A346RIE9_9COLE|nr:NADH dehydrogenase subunit 3 [Histeroidea sp. 3 KM-2017]
MKNLVYLMSITITISIIMIILASILSMKTSMDREKSSPFECGFDPTQSARNSFSLHFFMIAVIFLIFDVEITMLIPIIQTLVNSIIINHTIMSTYMLTILILGLYHEWNQGMISWSS